MTAANPGGAPRAICLWSGPRNVSTALMYSFRQRSDTRVVDEPLYGHYLRISNAEHPGRDSVLADMNLDGNAVMNQLLADDCDRPVLFLKQMAHHLDQLDRAFLAGTDNIFLVRDPEQMLPSLVNQIPEPKLRDTGLCIQADLLDELVELGQQPPVLDARYLLLDPAGVIAQLCRRLSLPFESAMLSWPAGPKPEDGIWAPHWYDNVHKSTGFLPFAEKTAPFPERLKPLLDECKPCYERLVRYAIKSRRM